MDIAHGYISPLVGTHPAIDGACLIPPADERDPRYLSEPEPTDIPPGPERESVYRERVARGEKLFCVRDARPQ